MKLRTVQNISWPDSFLKPPDIFWRFLSMRRSRSLRFQKILKSDDPYVHSSEIRSRIIGFPVFLILFLGRWIQLHVPFQEEFNPASNSLPVHCRFQLSFFVPHLFLSLTFRLICILYFFRFRIFLLFFPDSQINRHDTLKLRSCTVMPGSSASKSAH